MITSINRFKKYVTSGFAKTTLIYTISSFLNSATPFLLLPILTRYLSTEEYGIISMFNATASVFLPFLGMNISSAVLRKLADNDDEDNHKYVFNALIVAAVSTVLFTCVIFVLRYYICKWTALNGTYLLYVIFFVVATYLCELTLVMFQIQGMPKRYGTFQNLCTLLNLLLSILFVVFLKYGLLGRVLGLCVSKCLFAFIGMLYILCSYKIKATISIKYIGDIVTNFGLPLIPTNIKSTVLTYTDRLFITNMISVSETGIYAVGNQFSLPILLLAQAFNLAYVPWLYRKLNENDEQYKYKIVKFTYMYFGFILLIALLWSFLAKPLMTIISGKAYEFSTTYVFWLSLGYAFTAMHMMVVNYIYYTKKTKLYAIITVIVIFSNIILNYYFVNFNGSIGAAQATLIANIISFVLTWILASKVWKMPWFSFGKRGGKI
ncbi:lipopolysaccharide biosynthesis protein [[Clostridium] aminophilum]|uniref:Membrane protein involved in the export of O-antigen and teichoic acid n=1 Tax=[Clostridium] aminophilum TaxID=1526 RepID=A0A1I6K5U6_9FIRM|nr:oligosaccharide flippase family protein [[Clostridium] aminophilum]SFR86514.1 Membrane protein involved in the export of O-antigen and teichoic acid [[Clostridium] aminophilum]